MTPRFTEELDRRGWYLIDQAKHGHRCLEPDDECWCVFTNHRGDPLHEMLGALKGYATKRRQYMAVTDMADTLAYLVEHLGIAGRIILAPMPPHTTRKASKHDRRMELVCGTAAHKCENARAYNLLETVVAGPAVHFEKDRRDPNELMAKTAVALDFKIGKGDTIVVVDDVITTGAHFRMAKEYLEGVYDARVIGAFLARTPTGYEKDVVAIGKTIWLRYAQGQTAPPEKKRGLMWSIGYVAGRCLGSRQARSKQTNGVAG